MKRLCNGELLDVVRVADPLRTDWAETLTGEHLTSARRVLQSRLDAEDARPVAVATPRRWRRRLVAV